MWPEGLSPESPAYGLNGSDGSRCWRSSLDWGLPSPYGFCAATSPALRLLAIPAMVFPVPGLISVCGASVFLSPLLIGLLAGVGETIGEVSGYAIGYGGGTVVERRRFYPRLKRWMDTRGTLVIFLVSIIPNPVFDVVGIAAGGVRYPFTRFMAIVLVGKTIKGVMVAYTCYYGVTLLPWVE